MKIVQIAAAEEGGFPALYALADDGSLWKRGRIEGEGIRWVEVEPPPPEERLAAQKPGYDSSMSGANS